MCIRDRLSLVGHEAWNEALKAAILARQIGEAGMTRSNQGGWHSAENAHQWTDPAMQSLCAGAQHALAQVLTQQYPAAGEVGVQIGACWANVNGAGDWNVPHLHSGSAWVGAYYVDVGTPEEHLGQITIINPLPLAASFWQPQQITLAPRRGELLLFPGGMLHFVHPNRQPGARVSVAFNFQVKTQKQPWAG